MRSLVLFLLLSGCATELDKSIFGDVDNRDVQDNVWMNPICLIICSSSLNAASSTATGQGNTQAPSLTSSQSATR